MFLCSTSKGMLAFSNLCLHKIASNRPKVMKAFLAEDLAKGLKDLDTNINSSLVQRSLGVSWDIIKDVFMFQVSVAEKHNMWGPVNNKQSVQTPGICCTCEHSRKSSPRRNHYTYMTEMYDFERE